MNDRLRSMLIVGALWMMAVPAIGQDGDTQDAPRRERRERRERRFQDGDRQRGPEGRRGRGRRGERDGQWREQMEKWATATPEERLEMRADRQMRRMRRIYDLTEEQEVAARAEVVKSLNEQRNAMGPDAERFDAAITEMNQLMIERFKQRDAGEDGGSFEDDPRFEAARTKLRELREKHPDAMSQVAERIEKLLPAEQAERGKARREDMARWREEGGRRGGPDGREGRGRRERPRTDDAGPGEAALMLSELEAYTVAFMEKYSLDGAQVVAARAVLSDVQDRYERVQREAAQGRITRVEADVRLSNLDDDLAGRLDKLLTERQRRQVDSTE